LYEKIAGHQHAGAQHGRRGQRHAAIFEKRGMFSVWRVLRRCGFRFWLVRDPSRRIVLHGLTNLLHVDGARGAYRFVCLPAGYDILNCGLQWVNHRFRVLLSRWLASVVILFIHRILRC
jgi:hypothetical protein